MEEKIFEFEDEIDFSPTLDDHGFPIDEFKEELREGAWNVLHENPGLDCQDWIDILMDEYPSEVVDAFGPDPQDTFHQLVDWWETETYLDPITGICCTFQEWSEYFVNEHAVELYDMLVDAKTIESDSNGLSLPR